MASNADMRWRVVISAAAALALTATALTIALITAARNHSDTRQLSAGLVPAAAAANSLLVQYSAEQTSLRSYVTSGRASTQPSFGEETRQADSDLARLTTLLRGYPAIGSQLTNVAAAQQAWLAKVADPQLAAMARGHDNDARTLQADTSLVRPYVLAIRSAGADLQTMITTAQQKVTDRVSSRQRLLIAVLIGMCVLVALFAVTSVVGLWRTLLRPFNQLRTAIDAVAGGDYATRIPVVGPGELKGVGRSIEMMRMRLVTTLADRERAEFRFRQLFDAAPDAMIAIEWDGSVTMVNTQAVRLFGYRAGEFIGRGVETLVPEETRAAMKQARIRFFADPETQPLQTGLKMSGLRRDGSTFPAEITLSALPTGNGMSVAAAIRDVSERLAMDKERERLRAEAERERTERRTQQAQRLESLGQLVGGVAHDFNNLLNVILGYADFTAEEIQPLAAADPQLTQVLYDIEQVRAAAQQAARLTRQLLTFARHEVTRPEVLDLNGAVQDAGQLLHRHPGRAHRAVHQPGAGVVAGQGRQGPAGTGTGQPGRERPGRDAGRRAADYRHRQRRGRRDLRLRTARPGPRPLHPAPGVRHRGGHGPGHPGPAVRAVLLDQAEGTRHRARPGHRVRHRDRGRRHHRRLLRARPGHRVQRAAARHLRPGPAGRGDPGQSASPEGHGETVLLVEDETSLRDLTSRILTRHGYRVQAMATGAKAIELAQTPGQTVDLLLTDVVMPEMMGNEVAAAVRAIVPGVPALYMSGYAQSILDSHGVPALSIDILEKPFTEARLLARVRQALDAGPAGAGALSGSAELTGDERDGEGAFRPVTG